mmetsp:Transcript_30433/g.29803  ORF Transcript_30433/g.29803 Transcript_30433/m.29803 type:complete len:142 (-) Transcript_30433:3296-3721(-)
MASEKVKGEVPEDKKDLKTDRRLLEIIESYPDGNDDNEELVELSQSANVSSSYFESGNHDKTLERAKILGLKKITRFMTQFDDSVVMNDQIEAEEGVSKNSIVIIPLVDKNEISLIYHNRDNLEKSCTNLHPEIQKSAFVD